MMVMVGAMFKKMNARQIPSLHSVRFQLLILIVILLQVIAESYTLVESIHLNSVILVVLLHIHTQECGDGHQIRLRLVP